MTEEQRELMRQCAQRVVDNHAAGRVVDPHSLEWAKVIVGYLKPLGRPLTAGSELRASHQIGVDRGAA